ncbi:MAG TPA: DUF6779 domain-containing protein [Mycobacterium sp.]|nr:DUF6779 domain-containing protein [Mycobacterium sp.]
MTTVPSRGVRVRRGGHRPGWMLLTALLVLAIAASSVLVFTNRVELLKLAVIVSLWAAVVAAFASVLYRRQSDVDQARARDFKLVYDLQLDREISARREYELTVESQLRRELAVELRDQAADEVAALRAELSALRANLEVLFETDLGTRPALETERTTVRAYSDWAREADGASGARVAHEPVAVGHSEHSAGQPAESPIIDVPEVGVPTTAAPSAASPQPATDGPAGYPGMYQGSHRRMPDEGGWPAPDGRSPHDRSQPDAGRDSRAEPGPPRQTESWSRPWVPEPATPAAHWRPVPAEGEWLPPGAPGSNWTAETSTDRPAFDEPAPRSRHGRPADAAESVAGPAVDAKAPRQYEGRRRADARNSVPVSGRYAAPSTAPTASADLPEPPARHRDQEPGSHSAGSATGAESVADLLARLQTGSAGGGRRRRRREDD